MPNVLGLHSPTQGATADFKQARENIGASCVLWTAAEGPQDATEGVTNLVRLPTPQHGEGAQAYIERTRPQIAAWYASGIPAIFVPGNEPDLAETSGDVPEAWSAADWGGECGEIVPALRRAWGGIVLGAPAYSVGNMGWYTQQYADLFDVVTAHAYWWADKNEWNDPRAGAAWMFALDKGKPIYVTEVNSNPTTPEQLGKWAANLPESVAGVCFYICDDQGHDPQYNITPEQAGAIRSAYEKPTVVDPAPPPTPPAPIPPPVPPEVRTGAYSGSSDPRGYVPLDARWRDFIRARNPEEADAICATYDDGCATIGYDANLAIAQGCVETTEFTSPRWTNAHAAAGVGIYSDGTPDIIWGYSDTTPHGTVEAGIHAQLDLLTAYFGNDEEPFGTLAPHGFGGMVEHKTTLAGLDGVWAADTGYSTAICGVANDVLSLTPVPAPPPTPPSVTGAITLADILRVAKATLGQTQTEEGNPEYEWCEQRVEEWLADAGLPRLFYGTAALHADALVGTGVLRTGVPPLPGSVVVFGRAFDPQGHICIAAEYPLVITTYPGVISEIDANANGWYASWGYLGWYVPGGVSTEEDGMALPLDGKADDGVWAHGWAIAMKQADSKINRTAIFNKWLALVKQGVPVGLPVCDEYGFPDGRVCVNFSSGAVMTAIKQPDGSYAVFVN